VLPNRASFWDAARVSAELLNRTGVVGQVPDPTAMRVEITAPHRIPPATILRRYIVVVVGVLVLGALHLRHRPSTLCPFRELTGLPCPFCGGTTAAVHLGHGDPRGAVAASPIAVLLLATWPFVGTFGVPGWWRAPRNRWLVIATIVIFSEVWQLARFGIIHP
jgi:hypothetical protein